MLRIGLIVEDRNGEVPVPFLTCKATIITGCFKMKSNNNVSRCVLMLLLLCRLRVGRTLKSNHLSAFKLLQQSASDNVITHMQGSGSRSADCPVLPPCHCVQLSDHSVHQGSPSRVRVRCDSAQTDRRRVLKFSKSSLLTHRSFDHISLAYAGLNALPAATFRHIKVRCGQLSYMTYFCNIAMVS